MLTRITSEFLFGIIESILYYISLSDIILKFEVALNFIKYFL